MGNFDADEARYDRQNRMNPPDFAPGMEDGFGSDIFGSSSVDNGSVGDIFSNSGSFGGDIGGDPFGSSFNSPFGMPNTGMGDMQGNQGGNGNQTEIEDKFWEVIVKGGKGSVSFGKDIVKSFSGLTPLFWQKYGYRVLVSGLACIGVGVVARLFGLQSGLDIAIGGALCCAPGVVCFMFNTEKAKNCTSQYVEENNTMVAFSQPETDFSMDLGSSFGDSSSDFESTFRDDSGTFEESSDWGSEEDSFSFGDEEDDDFNFEEDEDDWGIEDTSPSPVMSAEEALNTMQEVPKGMYTRQYLYDMFSKVLPTNKPNFNTIVDVDEDEDEFLEWDSNLRDAAEVAGSKEDYLPDLLRLEKGLFTLTLTCNRPTGFKPDLVAVEVANIYANKDGKFNPNVYAKAMTAGKECRIQIFTGASEMVMLKDMMLQCESFILDSKNYMPVIFGIDQLGDVIKYDMKKLESIIITGMPRSGKSWFCQAVLTQMCAYVSPEELIFYICDPKEGISDFKSFKLPHVKRFVSKDEKIVETLREVVKVEGPRRKKIIGDAGFVNIWDYKERYPDVKLPIIYVVIDEVVTLASRMDKETNNEFRMLLRELISQLPALGIRAFLIPHVLNNDIIEKKTSDLVPCKISVCGDEGHIERATGSKFKDFPYKLTNKGDMAVRMPAVSSDTMFVHGPAITFSNPENNDLFDYLRRVWNKLEPEESGTVISNEADIEEFNNKLLEEVDEDIDIDQFFTDSNDNGLSGFMDD